MRLPISPPPLPDDNELGTLFRDMLLHGPRLQDRWLPWEELRRRPPPDGLGMEQWWHILRLQRHAASRPLPLLDVRGRPFSIALPDEVFGLLRAVHEKCAGTLVVDPGAVGRDAQRRYILSSLREEAVQSSLLEGAATTRRVAKEMLRTGRLPHTEGERMVLANYRAMEQVSSWRDLPITPDRILALHATVTKGVLADEDRGRLRRSHEAITVVDHEGTLLHQPPIAAELPERLEKLCQFAEGGGSGFTEDPVIRAILLHFMLAYDHPFIDGNGRTARALFYWSMLRSSYWLAEYLPLSRVLRQRSTAYATSFLHVESDENDTTYFLLDQLRSLVRCIEEVEQHLANKMQDIRMAERAFRDGPSWNHRQLALLRHALRHPDATYTLRSHQNSHGIAYATARSDLFALVDAGHLVRRKRGRSFVFHPADVVDSPPWTR